MISSFSEMISGGNWFIGPRSKYESTEYCPRCIISYHFLMPEDLLYFPCSMIFTVWCALIFRCKVTPRRDLNRFLQLLHIALISYLDFLFMKLSAFTLDMPIPQFGTLLYFYIINGKTIVYVQPMYQTWKIVFKIRLLSRTTCNHT